MTTRRNTDEATTFAAWEFDGLLDLGPEPLNVLSANTFEKLMAGDSVNGEAIIVVGTPLGRSYWVIRGAGTWNMQ